MINTAHDNEKTAADASKKAVKKAAPETDDTVNVVDVTLRPQHFKDYVGQDAIKRNLRIFIDAAKERGESIEHVLLHGPAGLGKTTLANIIAKEMGAAIKTTSGPAIERVGDLGSILTNLQDGDILFIDEIHRLNKTVEEILYPAMEDHKLDIVVGKGSSAHTLQLDLPHFTLVGATTRLGALTNPLRDRFGVIHKLEFYNDGNIKDIIRRSAAILECTIDDGGQDTLSRAARATPRVANRLLKRARDLAQIQNDNVINAAIAQKTLDMLEIDHLGLDPTDRAILTTLTDTFDGRPVGLQTLATIVSEEMQTLEDVYEPYLMKCGLLTRTPRGRMATNKAYTHMKIVPKEKTAADNSQNLFV